MAAAGVDALNALVFVGGSDNPYNYNGIGYNGDPSQPSGGALIYDLERQSWTQRKTDAIASMDHRGLVEVFPAGGADADASGARPGLDAEARPEQG